MSNDTQVLDRNPVSPPVSGNQVPSQMRSLNKEVLTGQNLSEFVRPAGSEISPNLSQEEKESGVEVKNDRPDLTFEHTQIGLEHSGATVPVPSGPTGLVQISESKDIKSSATWLNALREKIQKVMQLMGV